MSNIQIFDNDEFGSVRVVVENNEILFSGKDIATALGYKDTDQAIRKHCKHAKLYPVKMTGQVRYIKFIPESDVYRLIIKSKLPSAERFEKWVMEDVLPTIRKHGTYMTPETIEKVLYNPDFIIGLAKQIKEERAKRQALEAENKQMRPKAEAFDDLISTDGKYTMSEVAKLLNWGRNRLFKFLRMQGILRNNNEPYQEYVDRGYFKLRTYTIKHTDFEEVKVQTLVTPKGLEWIRKILKREMEFTNL